MLLREEIKKDLNKFENLKYNIVQENIPVSANFKIEELSKHLADAENIIQEELIKLLGYKKANLKRI